jgi:pentafunctional AROM polypeptide
MSDKKNEAQEIRFVFIKDIGVYYEKSVPIEIPLIMEVLSNKIHPISCVLPTENIPFEPETVGSKSITNRVILMGSLGEGVIEIENFLQAEDTEVLLEALKELGLCHVIEEKKNKLIMKGNGGCFKEIIRSKEIVLNIQNSGLSARFLLTLLSFTPGVFVLTGNEYMKKRPMGDLIKALKSNTDCEYVFLEKEECLPIKIINDKKNHGLKGGNILLNSKASSQYVSALLLCAPFAKSPVTITLEELKENEEITSEPFIEMTLTLMKEFGIEAKKVSFNSYFIPNGTYKNPGKFAVEPDFTALTYDLAFVALFGGSTKIKHISKFLFNII